MKIANFVLILLLCLLFSSHLMLLKAWQAFVAFQKKIPSDLALGGESCQDGEFEETGINALGAPVPLLVPLCMTTSVLSEKSRIT